MITHYTDGYGGKLNYHTTCGKEIHSHDKEETATVHPEKVDCQYCKNTLIYIDDLQNFEQTKEGLKRRIFIESDILHEDELNSAKRTVKRFCEDSSQQYTRRVFNDVLDYAWHDLETTWAAVKKADEIYCVSSLMPLSGGSYMGAPVIFNKMCERAVAEKITGKSIFILNKLEYIEWYMIDIPVMKKAFKANKLFMYDDDFELIEIDVETIKK